MDPPRTVIRTSYDDGGRKIHERATALGADVGDAVLRICDFAGTCTNR